MKLRILFALAVVAAFVAAGHKPGHGGGGGGPVPPGSIYVLDVEGPWGLANGVYSMDADGSNATALPAVVGPKDEPSYLEHADGSGGSHRWFLEVFTGPFAGRPGGIYAAREDGAVEVQLLAEASSGLVLSDADLPSHCSGETTLRWGKDDSFLSFVATDAGGQALFVADVDFDASGVPSLSSAPAALFYETAVIRSHDWSPAGDRVAYWLTGAEIHVATIGAGGVTRSFLTGGRAPEWSPVDDRIAYNYLGSFDRAGIATIRADETDPVQITGTGNARTLFGPAFWSPDGAFLAYVRGKAVNNFNGSQDFDNSVLVVPAGGGRAADATPANLDVGCVVGWR